MAKTPDVKKTSITWIESKKQMVSLLNMQFKQKDYSINVNDFHMGTHSLNDRKRICNQFSIELCGLFFFLIFSIGLVIGVLPSTNIGHEEKAIAKVTPKPQELEINTENEITDGCSRYGGITYWVGDGFCDDINNNKACDYDNGDCCGLSMKKNFCVQCICKVFTCKTDKDCYGNGYCQARECKCLANYEYAQDCSHYGLSKILVTTGKNSHGTQTTSEIVDLTVKGGNMCNNWPDFPKSVYGATGGLIGNTVMICGGFYVDECYSLTSEKATLVTHMSVWRTGAASIVRNDNTLWVTAGYSGGYLKSTEYVTVTGTTPGPDLPIWIYEHAIVAINSTCSMFIGGFYAGYSATTFFYDHNEGEWITGPSLMQARYSHAAGIVTDEVTDEHSVAVTGGYGDSSHLDSSEILQDGNWVQGPLLPIRLMDHSMVRLGKGQAILGGISNMVHQDKIYTMTCSNRNCIISLLDRELSVPKEAFVAIPIPDTISGCITGDCQFRTLIEDGFCQDFNNNRHCSFDGGDCCGPCVNKEFCTECKCKTGNTNKISNARVGNGFCNDETNVGACNFDGGDCCGTCVNFKYCSVCECIGENSGNIMNAFLDNGLCQDELNHGDCMFDGFDCCGYDSFGDGDYDDNDDIAPGETIVCTECLCKECAVTITQPFGLITSPGFPQTYQNGIDCTWNIQLSIGQLIQFKFLHFDVEDAYMCGADSLTIYDGGSNTSPMLYPNAYGNNPYCGDFLPPSQISSSNQLFFHFQSNWAITGSGFKLEYRIWNPISCELPDWYSDGYCDDENNNEDCWYDGGDCCGDYVYEDYCNECLCLED